MLFDDPVYAEELVASLSEPLSGNALDFCYFAEACREHGIGPSAFESRGEQQAEGAGRGDATVCGKMSAGRRAEDVRARRVALAFAFRRRCEMDAKARLFSKAQAPAAAALGGRSLSSGGAAHGVEPANSESRAVREVGGSGLGAMAQEARKAAPASSSRGRCEGEAGARLFSQGRSLVDGAPGAASSRGVARDVRGGVRGARGRSRDSMLDTHLCRKLSALRLDEDIVDAVLAEMQRLFGQGLAWELAGAEWLLSWGRWELFVEEVQRAAGSWSEGLLVHHARRLIKEFLFALCRVVASQVGRGGPVRTNEGALQELRAAGFVRREAMMWGNNCLADSLLQLLIFHGIVAEGVGRKTACSVNRARLEEQEDLVPRDVHGCVDFGGYLQHDRHAQPTLEFFFELFACSAEVLPAAGFRLVVHARSDDDEHPADEMVICEGCGRRAGPCLELHLFNWTGRRHGGYHYDPLLLDPLVVDLVGVGGEAGDSAAASSQSRRVLRRENAMDGDEDLAALGALGRRARAGAGAEEVEDAAAAATAAAAARDLAPTASSKPLSSSRQPFAQKAATDEPQHEQPQPIIQTEGAAAQHAEETQLSDMECDLAPSPLTRPCCPLDAGALSAQALKPTPDSVERGGGGGGRWRRGRRRVRWRHGRPFHCDARFGGERRCRCQSWCGAVGGRSGNRGWM